MQPLKIGGIQGLGQAEAVVNGHELVLAIGALAHKHVAGVPVVGEV
jgi:hypothetical protein